MGGQWHDYRSWQLVKGVFAMCKIVICMLIGIANLCAASIAAEHNTYHSRDLQNLVDKACRELESVDYEKKTGAIDLFFDLQRTDYLVRALTSRDYNLRIYTCELLEMLPMPCLVDVLISSLNKPEIFPLEKGGEQAAAQTVFLEHMNKMIKIVLSSQKQESPSDLDLRQSAQRDRIVELLKRIPVPAKSTSGTDLGQEKPLGNKINNRGEKDTTLVDRKSVV
jgi:hypothetical protein